MNPITRPPTAKQTSILNFVTHFVYLYGVFPSTRIIQQAFGFKSQNAAVCHLRALARRKLINHTNGRYSLPTPAA
jgi:repressor LexA